MDSYSTTSSALRSRALEREDAQSVIDNASAILSMGGGTGTMSVRSGFLSQISSVATPATCFS